MSSSPKSVVVTGANRGIGLTIVKELLKDKNIQYIIATAREVENATVSQIYQIKEKFIFQELKSINDPRLHILPLDVVSDKSIDTFVSKVTDIVKESEISTNLHIFEEPNRATLVKQFDVNTISLVIITQKFLPLLRKSASKVSGDKLSISRSAVVNISSGLASVSLNNYGSDIIPMLAYSMSKSAVNQFNKIFSIDVKDDHILTVAFEPGWIQTNLGGPHAPLKLEEAIPVLVSSFYKLDNTHHGGYFERDLTPRPY
ncbi:hypothetical protein GCK72_001680 [Caenorhabditis remanei]|uniref:Uncharacterized protein n=1 Tax=Caenorhabditis remanei TaxID=31234 RepID=A0A6A5HUF0_CAERE|nr:hypothetical protein GCK72_001680 [Caenorhabditis remanei]KAF1769863.1 hypothetical protein GCK72_001680 [Caenorhabditis remanei]